MNETNKEEKLIVKTENPTTESLPVVPLVESEYKSGNPDAASLSYEVPEVAEVSHIPNPGPTNQLTDQPQLLTIEASEANVSRNEGRQVNINTTTVLNLANQYGGNRLRPFAVLRGTNILYPFGASYTALAASKSESTINAFGKFDVSEIEDMSGSFRSPASLREIWNFKAFGEMKDAIISYRSRSIAFTNLGQTDMFALEISREARLANCALIFYAKKAAKDYVRMLSDRGYKYDSSITSLIIDPDISKEEFLLYSQMSKQKTFDPTLFVRMGMLTRLHQGSKRNGLMPNLIIQDCVISDLPNYQPSADITNTAGSYRVRVPIFSHAIEQVGTTDGNHFTFLELVGLYLPNNAAEASHNKAMLMTILSNLSSLANATVNSYKIITGAIDVIEANRGAKFETIDAFLPIKGVYHSEGNCFLDYIEDEPSFSYFFKERFEYAPLAFSSENSAGANKSMYNYNLVQFNGASAWETTPYFKIAGSVMRRPIGLYHGEKAWQTDEIAFIGVFKQSDKGTGAIDLISYGLTTEFAGNNGDPVSIDTTSTSNWNLNASPTSSDNDTASMLAFEDTMYGDIYTPVLMVRGWDSEDPEGLWYSYGVIADIITFAASGYSLTGSASVSYFTSFVPKDNAAMLIGTGVNPTQWDARAGSFVWVVMDRPVLNAAQQAQYVMAVTNIYNELDLAKGCVLYSPSTAGVADIPVIMQVNYRGNYWLEMSLVTVENTLITMGAQFYMTYKNNAQVKGERPTAPKAPVSNA